MTGNIRRYALRPASVLVFCSILAGCAGSSDPPPSATSTTPASVAETPPPLGPKEAVATLEKLAKRIRTVSDEGWAGGQGYRMVDPPAPQVARIDLLALFYAGSDSITQVVCSEVTDEDIAFFNSFDTLEELEIPRGLIQGHGLAALRDLKHLRRLNLTENLPQLESLVLPIPHELDINNVTMHPVPSTSEVAKYKLQCNLYGVFNWATSPIRKLSCSSRSRDCRG